MNMQETRRHATSTFSSVIFQTTSRTMMGGPGGGVARAPPPAPGDPPRPAALLGLPYTPLVQCPPKILKQPHRPAPVRPVHAAHSLPALHTHTTHLSAPCGSDPTRPGPHCPFPIAYKVRLPTPAHTPGGAAVLGPPISAHRSIRKAQLLIKPSITHSGLGSDEQLFPAP